MALKPTIFWPTFYFPKHYCGAWLDSDLCWCWDKHELFFQSHEPAMLCVDHVETSMLFQGHKPVFQGHKPLTVIILRQVCCFRKMSQWRCVLIMLRQVWVVSRAWASDGLCCSCLDKCVILGKWASDVCCSCWDKCVVSGKWASDVVCWSCWGKYVLSGAQVSDVECWSCWDKCVVSGTWASDVVLIMLRQAWVVSLFSGTSQWCWGPTCAGVTPLSMLYPALTEASFCWSCWDKCVLFQGHEPVMLRTQYRCHPIISAVSNSLFYQNQLVDGVTAQDRPPVLVSSTVYISSFNRGLNLVKTSVQHCFLFCFYIYTCFGLYPNICRALQKWTIDFTVKHVFTWVYDAKNIKTLLIEYRF